MANPRIIRVGTALVCPRGFWARATVIEINLVGKAEGGLRPYLVLDAWVPTLSASRKVSLDVGMMLEMERQGTLQIHPQQP